MKPVYALPFGISASLLLSGCFTAVAKMGGAWNGDYSTPPAAVALDVATAPIQAPLFIVGGIGHGIDKSKRSREKAQYDSLITKLRASHTAGYAERWDRRSHIHFSAFVGSFSDPLVRYEASDLELIYRDIPSLRDYVFKSEACTTEFLRAHFDEMVDRSRHASYTGLANLVSHPNTPIELVERIAASTDIPVGAVYPAREALEKRKNEPNKAVEPTPVAVTPDANASGAPSTSAAHL